MRKSRCGPKASDCELERATPARGEPIEREQPEGSRWAVPRFADVVPLSCVGRVEA